MDEEDDSGYEARSTVTTSNSICQTDLQQLVYNSHNRPATVNYTNYSNYSSNSLILSSTSLNELRRSPRSNLNTSRPQSSAYSTISSCSLNNNNRPFCDPISTFEQQHPSLEEYQPLDQFRILDQPDQTYQSTNMSSANRSLNFRTSSPDYEQDWSTGEQDEDSDYIIEHVQPVYHQIDHTNNRNLTRRNRYRLLNDDDDLEQDDNDVEYLERRNFNDNYSVNLDENMYQNVDENIDENVYQNIDESSDENIAQNIDDNVDENISYKNDNHHQLANILNSPLDRTPFSSPLSLPSSNLSNSNESSNNSSPKIKVPEPSFSESSSLNLSPIYTKQSSSSKFESPITTNKAGSSIASPTSIKQESPNPIYLSEEEFASRKSALRERINRTEMLLNSINNNCNRFRTITSAINSRSQELLNQRRQAEIEIDNIVQQNTTTNTTSEPNTNSPNKFNSFNTFQQQPQPRIERDLKSTIENQESHVELLSDSPTTSSTVKKNEMNKKEVLTDRTVQSNKDKMDKIQNQLAGDANNKLNTKATTIEFSNPTTNYKDIAEPIDHLNKLNLTSSRYGSNMNSKNDLSLNRSMNRVTISNERPTPITKLPSIPDSNSNKPINDNQLLSTNNNGSKNNQLTTAAVEFKSSNQTSSSSSPSEQQHFDLDKQLEKSNSKSSFKSVNKSDSKSSFKSVNNSDFEYDSKINSKTDLKIDLKSRLKSDTSPKSYLLKINSRNESRKSPKSDLKSNRKSENTNCSEKININSKLKNNLKNNLIDIKSDLSDLSELLNIQTVPKTTSLASNDVKLMSFTVKKEKQEKQPNKSVNTEIDSRLMDHILSKICAQRDMQSNTNDSSNIPSTSKQQIEETNEQQTKKVNKIESKKTESTESKQCQTDKIQNQDASVSVNESDLGVQRKQQMIHNSGNDEKKAKNEKCTTEKARCSKSELCEDCKRRCYSSQILIECNRQFNRQESLNHCCVKCAQETCASIFHSNHSHLPVCINTFNHNTFTSLPNLAAAYSATNIARIEQGTNTEPNIDTDRIEVNSNKRDKQTQCILGLSLEQQQREYIEQQQQKYLKLKEELKAKEKQKTNNDLKSNDKEIKNDADIVKESDKKDKENDQRKRDIKNVEDDEEKKAKKQIQKQVESPKILESEKDELIDSSIGKKDSIKSDVSSAVQSESFDKDKTLVDKDEIESDKDETKNETNEKPSLDITLPVKLPFKSDKMERKLIDLKKEKNVKTHSKIIIEFSGKSKRERSAVDSFTKLDKDGRLTKKTLVSNTKEISVPIKTTKDKKEEQINENLYPLSSTPQDHLHQSKNNYSPTLSPSTSPKSTNENENQLISNQNTLYLCKKTDQNNSKSNLQWKEASHSEISNEMSADPLFDENNKAHPTKSITLSTITTFDRTLPGEPQRIDHSNKYQRCFENPSIHEPLIESNLTMLDEPSGHESASNLSSSSSIENLIEQVGDENRFKTDENLTRINNSKTLNKEQFESTTMRPKSDYKIDQIRNGDLLSNSKTDRDELSSSESRSAESRLSNTSQQSRSSDRTLVGRIEEPDINVNSRSASRVSFNLPDNYRDTTDSSIRNYGNSNKPIANYSTEILESNLDHELAANQETDLDRIKETSTRTRLAVPSSQQQQQPTGLLETELDDHHLIYDAEEDDHHQPDYYLNNLKADQQENDNISQALDDYEKQRNDYSQFYTQSQEEQKPQSSKLKIKERKTKSNKKKSHTSKSASQAPVEHISDQSSLFSTSTTQPRSKQLNDSGFLSPEIYHSSPYELAYKQVNKDENNEKIKDKKQTSKIDRKKSSSSSDKKMDKKSKHKSLLKNKDNNGGLQFTEHSSNTEIITRLTKTSYPSNYASIDSNSQPKLIEKQLKQLKRNKMVLDQILNSPEIKSSSSKLTNKKSSRSGEKKRKSGCKISSQITMDLPIYKEEKIIQKTAKSVSCPVKSVSLEELDKERDLDRKSVVSQHSYSQKSGEFNTMTKFQRYKPSSSSKLSKKNKSSIHLNQPDETKWEYSMQCNCVNGSRANVLTNVKHRRILFLPLQQYETSL